jgi:hypothetical protein
VTQSDPKIPTLTAFQAATALQILARLVPPSISFPCIRDDIHQR